MLQLLTVATGGSGHAEECADRDKEPDMWSFANATMSPESAKSALPATSCGTVCLPCLIVPLATPARCNKGGQGRS